MLERIGDLMIGVIFDFNGTLFADSDKQEAAWRDFAVDTFNKTITDAAFRSFVHGRNNAFTMEFLADRLLTDEEIAGFVADKEARYRRLVDADPRCATLSLDVRQLLDELKERGVPMTIATASGQENVSYYIEKFSLDRWFAVDKIVYDDGTMAGKPAPDLYLAAARRLSLAPADCLVFEDAVSGIAAAYRARVGAIVALGDPEDHILGGLPGVACVIPDFHHFDRFLLRAMQEKQEVKKWSWFGGKKGKLFQAV